MFYGLKQGDTDADAGQGWRIRMLQVRITDLDPKALNPDRSLAWDGKWHSGTTAGFSRVINGSRKPGEKGYLDPTVVGFWQLRRLENALWMLFARLAVPGTPAGSGLTAEDWAKLDERYVNEGDVILTDAD